MVNPDKVKKLFGIAKLGAKQAEGLSCEARHVNFCGVEGSGKSFVAMLMALLFVMTDKNRTVFFVCPTRRQCDDKYDRVLNFIIESGKRGHINKAIGGLILFKSKSKILFISASQKPSSIKGFHSQYSKATKQGSDVMVLIDDATSISQQFSDGMFASLFTAKEWRLILSYNATASDEWVYSHHQAGLKGDKDIKTFEFFPQDNPSNNAEVIEHLKKVDQHYDGRFSGRWDGDKYQAFPPTVIEPAVDRSYCLNVSPTEQDTAYCIGADLNDPLAESVGEDRDYAVFLTLAKQVKDNSVKYKVVTYENFKKASVAEWVEAMKRMARRYPISEYFIESPHASHLIEQIRHESELTGRVALCNPHRVSNEYSHILAFAYLGEVLRNKLLRIPYDAHHLLKELRGLRVMKTSTGIKYDHRKHAHNDHVSALVLALWGMKDIDTTVTLNVAKDIYVSNREGGFSEPYTRGSRRSRHDDLLCTIDERHDREFLEVDGSPDFNWDDVGRIQRHEI